MNEKLIASNMIAIARGRKGDAKRSAMLRMIMPFLSNQTGEKLAQVINDSDSARFGKIWDSVKHEIVHRLKQKHKVKATAADVAVFQRDNDDGGTSVNVTCWGSEKVRINIGGVEIWNRPDPGFLEMTDANYDTETVAQDVVAHAQQQVANQVQPFETHDGLPVGESIQKAVTDFFQPEEAKPANSPRLDLKFDLGDCGYHYQMTDGQMVTIIHEVCKRLLYKDDPCPLEPLKISMENAPFNPENQLAELMRYFTASKS